MRELLIKNGVANLKKFGYPSVNADNILTDPIFSAFFRGNLEEWADLDNMVVQQAAQLLLAELPEEAE